MATISWYPVSVESDPDESRFRVSTDAIFSNLEIRFFQDELKKRFPLHDVQVDSYSNGTLTLSFELDAIDLSADKTRDLVSDAASSATFAAQDAEEARKRLSSWAKDLEADPDDPPTF